MERLIWLEEEWSKFARRGRKKGRGGGERESGRGDRRVGGGVELAWLDSGREGGRWARKVDSRDSTKENRCFFILQVEIAQYDRMIPRQGCKTTSDVLVDKPVQYSMEYIPN